MPETRFEVFLTKSAEQDLTAIYAYIAEFDSESNANHVLGELLETFESLTIFPERGTYPKELRLVGIQEYRQVFSSLIE